MQHLMLWLYDFLRFKSWKKPCLLAQQKLHSYKVGNTKQKLKVEKTILHIFATKFDEVHNKHKTITRVSPAHKRMSTMTTGFFRELPDTVPDQIQTRTNVCFLQTNITLIRVKTYYQLSTPIIPFQFCSFGVFLCCFGLFPRAAVSASPVFWRRINMAELKDCAELKVSAELNA